MKGKATVDGTEITINVPKDYGKPKRRKTAPFRPSAGAILRAAVKAAGKGYEHDQ